MYFEIARFELLNKDVALELAKMTKQAESYINRNPEKTQYAKLLDDRITLLLNYQKLCENTISFLKDTIERDKAKKGALPLEIVEKVNIQFPTTMYYPKDLEERKAVNRFINLTDDEFSDYCGNKIKYDESAEFKTIGQIYNESTVTVIVGDTKITKTKKN